MSIYKQIKVNGKYKQEHRCVWEQANGTIPDGYEIHHINGKHKDNRLENLMMLTHQEHRQLHCRLRKEGRNVVDKNDPLVQKYRAMGKRHYERNRDKILEDNRKKYAENINGVREHKKEYSKEHSAERKKYFRKYREINKEKLSEKQHEKYVINKETYLAAHKKYYLTHREELIERSKQNYKEHKTEKLASSRCYRETHKEELKEYRKNKYANNKELYSARNKLDYAIRSGKPKEIIDELKSKYESLKGNKNDI